MYLILAKYRYIDTVDDLKVAEHDVHDHDGGLRVAEQLFLFYA